MRVRFTNWAQAKAADVFFMKLEGARVKHSLLAPGEAATKLTAGAPPQRRRKAFAGIDVALAPRQPAVAEGAGAEGAGAGGAGAAGAGAYRAHPGEAVCSQDDAHELRIKFCNNDNSHVCDVFWVDYDGHDVHRKRLEPGESYMEASFVTHPWRVRDCATGEELRVGVGAETLASAQCFSVVWNSSSHAPGVSFMARNQISKNLDSGALAAAQQEPAGEGPGIGVEGSLTSASLSLLSSGDKKMYQRLHRRELRDAQRDPVKGSSADVTVVILPRLMMA